MFSCAVKPVTLVLTSLGGICKPEVVIARLCEDISIAATTQFSGMLDPLHLRRHRQAMENTIKYKPE